MNKDLQIAKNTVRTEIEALKKLLDSFRNFYQFSKSYLEGGPKIS